MSLMPSAELSIDYKIPETLLRALGPELGREIPRTNVDGRIENGRLVLSIEATDISALRAALNSYLRWIKITKDMIEITGG